MPSPDRRLSAGRFSMLVAVIMGQVATAQAKAADFQYPFDVAVGERSTFVADRNLPGIWNVTRGQSTVFFQGSKAFRTPLNAVRCVAVDHKGRLIAGDSATRQVYRFDNGKPVPLLKTRTGIGIPIGLAIDRQDNVIVSDLETQRLCRIPENGDEPVWFAEIPAPRGITVDDHDRIWVISHGPDQLVRFEPDAKPEVIVAGRPFQFPHDVALDEAGVVYVSDGYAKTIWMIGADGKPAKWLVGEPLKNPVGICWSRKELLVSDPHAQAIFSVDRDGRVTRVSPQPMSP